MALPLALGPLGDRSPRRSTAPETGRSEPRPGKPAVGAPPAHGPACLPQGPTRVGFDRDARRARGFEREDGRRRIKPLSHVTDPRVVKALAHPVRVRILSALERRQASPNELDAELGVPLGTVSYHVRRLADVGLIKLVEEARRRG